MAFGSAKSAPYGSIQPGPRMIDGTDIMGILSGLVSFSGMSLTGFFSESSSDNITAASAGTQAGATALVSELNRISTVGGAGYSVSLPASFPGATIIVENAGANPMQVFGAGTDTINGVATATGVSQMAGSVVIYTCYTAGSWFANGLGTGYSGSLETQSSSTGLTAAGTNQATALQLTAMMNQVSTAAASTGVILPTSATGLQITVINNGANTLNVYPPVGSNMNGTLNAASTLATATVGIYFCFNSTNWVSK